ncbi:pentapeptide repeat-containing protein [Streptomyces sp. NPDC002692]
MSGADLTRTNLEGARLTGAVNMLLPEGATWDSFTRWPDGLASAVMNESVEVSPGIYQVGRGGPTPDRSTVGV